MADKKNAKAGKTKPAPAAAPAAPKVVKAKPAIAAKLAAPKLIEAKPEPKLIEASPAATAAATAQAAAETTTKINEGTTKMQNETTQVINDRMQAAMGDVNERTRTAMEKSARVMEEMTDLTKGNVEAIVASSKVAARAVETLGQEAAEFGRRSFEQASNTVRSFAEVKSPTDFFRLQSEFAKSQFDAIVAESSKMSEAMLKIAGEVAEPITSRYSVAAERVKNIA